MIGLLAPLVASMKFAKSTFNIFLVICSGTLPFMGGFVIAPYTAVTYLPLRILQSMPLTTSVTLVLRTWTSWFIRAVVHVRLPVCSTHSFWRSTTTTHIVSSDAAICHLVDVSASLSESSATNLFFWAAAARWDFVYVSRSFIRQFSNRWWNHSHAFSPSLYHVLILTCSSCSQGVRFCPYG